MHLSTTAVKHLSPTAVKHLSTTAVKHLSTTAECQLDCLSWHSCANCQRLSVSSHWLSGVAENTVLSFHLPVVHRSTRRCRLPLSRAVGGEWTGPAGRLWWWVTFLHGPPAGLFIRSSHFTKLLCVGSCFFPTSWRPEIFVSWNLTDSKCF